MEVTDTDIILAARMANSAAEAASMLNINVIYLSRQTEVDKFASLYKQRASMYKTLSRKLEKLQE